VSLLDFLRERLGLLGTEKGCDQVLVDGERILSCLALAVQYEGRPVTTIEGLAVGGALHPLQPSHVTADRSAETIEFSRDELRERMSGNLCRCGAHNGIVAAITQTYAWEAAR
jgi:xanthine dehydrogenase YagT iron-sulfur-binding subunit